ncbi:hypothetical protein QVD17_03949 [Tagetes erecta]|uniref:Uncharacterized protein n=1 Tax=Tagetes erecta TaxID=13708 RepID=A0AAD8LFM7_TARER|nr:hypothetical protein QVD17_03949 [Tagetes erecta]
MVNFKTVFPSYGYGAKIALSFLPYPLYFWLGKGRSLSPEAHGRLVRLLRAKLKPWELVLPPDELFETEESRDFLEYSLLYGWTEESHFDLTKAIQCKIFFIKKATIRSFLL